METTYEAQHSGPGYGWHVYRADREDANAPVWTHAAGPYTTKAQAELKVRELERRQAMADRSIRAAKAGPPS